MNRPVVVAGSGKDPNVLAFQHKLGRLGKDFLKIELGGSSEIALRWDLNTNLLVLGGVEIFPEAIFQRYDFTAQTEGGTQTDVNRSTAWYLTLEAFALVNAQVGYFNRQVVGGVGNKPYILAAAQKIGLLVPGTLITNDLAFLRSNVSEKIAKPLNGGGYCRHLEECLKETSPRTIGNSPAIVQNRLVAPEWRIYVIGQRTVTFRLESPSLDYREHQDASIVFEGEAPKDIEEKVVSLCQELGLTFAAADFKTDPVSQRWIFLEINSAPMFAVFDLSAKGVLIDQMADFLLQS